MLYICADEIQETLDGYSPDKAEQYHSEAATLADKKFEKSIKDNNFKKVVIVCGGTASGKTEFAHSQFEENNVIVFDGTLSTNEGAGNKISKSLKKHKLVEVYFIIPADLLRSYAAFLGRERQFSPTHFFYTHSGSRKTLQYIHERYSKKIQIKIIESNYNENNKIYFNEITFLEENKFLEYIEDIQKTVAEIEKLVL